jgi:hypothetical protein
MPGTNDPVDVPTDVNDVYVDTIMDVSISMTVLLLFTPMRQVISSSSYHPCYVERLNFNIPNTPRINSILNSLCDNAFKIDKEIVNTFGLSGTAYDLFFFQDRILDDDDDEFRLELTERSNARCQHYVGLRFIANHDTGEYESPQKGLVDLFQRFPEAFRMHLLTVDNLNEFRLKMNIDGPPLDAKKGFQACYFQLMIEFHGYTSWRCFPLNGQNRMCAALSFMLGCNFDLQNWCLSPCSIEPQNLLDVHVQENESLPGSGKTYSIFGQNVGTVPQKKDLLAYIDRARLRPKLTSGLKFIPSLEVRVISNSVANMDHPNLESVMIFLKNVSFKRAVDERSLSNTSMPAKCSPLFTVLCDEITKTYGACKAFEVLRKANNDDVRKLFVEKYPDYCSDSDVEGKLT